MILCFVPDSNTIHHFNQNKYDSFLRSIPFHQLPCSHCAHRGCLHRHAYYTRRLYIAEIDSFVIIRVLRVRCTRCGTTHALLPHFVIPYQHIPLIDTQDEQDALKQLQEQFSAQIDQLIQHQVLTADLLEIDAEEEYEPTFGTFSRWGESDILLQQIYRMWEDQDYKSVDYTMDEQTGKITRIEISQQKQMTYTEAQLKELSRQDPPPWDRRRFRRMPFVRPLILSYGGYHFLDAFSLYPLIMNGPFLQSGQGLIHLLICTAAYGGIACVLSIRMNRRNTRA